MSNPPDPFEFVRNLWAQMGIPGFGQAGAMQGGMPSFAPEEIEKRLGELKQIRQWLEINLNMLSLQVNGLEMQLAAIKGFKSAPGAEFAAQAAQAMRDAAAPQGAHAQAPFGAPQFGQASVKPAGFGPFPFGAAPAVPATPPAPPAAPATVAAPTESEAAKPLGWPDPTAWMQSLQSEFVKNMKAMAPDAVPAKKAARGAAPAKKAASKKATAKKAAARKSRGSP